MSTTATLKQPKTHEKIPDKIKFRLLRGRHIEVNYKVENGKYVLDANERRIKLGTTVHQVERDPVTNRWKQPIFESHHELDKQFNVVGFPPKFERLTEYTQQTVNPLERMSGETIQNYLARLADMTEEIKKSIDEQTKQLDTMDRDALIAFAEAEEIDVSKCKDVLQLKATIKTAVTARK